MHPVVRSGRRWLALACAVLFGIPGVASAASITLYTFNLDRSAVYTVKNNSTVVATRPPSSSGALSLTLDADPGDVISLIRSNNPDIQPPPRPLFNSVTLITGLCVRSAWTRSTDPNVTGYVVYFGTKSVAGGQATEYERSVEAGASLHRDVCGLETGRRYFFAIRARNHADMLSPYSAEFVVDVVPLAVSFSEFDGSAVGDDVHLSWKLFADEPVLRYHVYRWSTEEPETLLVDDSVPADATEFVDSDVSSATTYHYIIAAVKENGDEVYSVSVSVTTSIPSLRLDQNVPNPFNPTTRIPFNLAGDSKVTLRVFDVRGRLVATLFDGNMPGGAHEVTWAGLDDRGSPVTSGAYFYMLTAGKKSMSRKMMLLK